MSALGSYESEALSSLNKTLVSQSQAMKNMVRQYEVDEFSRSHMVESLSIFHDVHSKDGKVILCGIGKSFKIANKLVATLNSLSIQSSLLHPAEALHGDLGIIRPHDCVLMLTASGNTPELLQVLPHISEDVPIVLLTCNKESKLSKSHQVRSLLYIDLASDLKEEVVHGIPAPTVSAELSLALADAAILTLSELIECDVQKRKRQFALKHPGGSIGASLSHLNELAPVSEDRGKSVSTHVSSTSLLSLEQLRSTLQESSASRGDSVSTSLTSSDDESSHSNEKVDYKLSVKLTQAAQSDILQLKESELDSVDQSTFAEWIIFFDYVVYKVGKLDYAIDTLEMKNLFKSEFGFGSNIDDETWGSFLWKLKFGFRLVNI